MSNLGNLWFELGINDKDANDKLNALQKQLDGLKKSASEIKLNIDTDALKKSLDSINLSDKISEQVKLVEKLAQAENNVAKAKSSVNKEIKLSNSRDFTIKQTQADKERLATLKKIDNEMANLRNKRKELFSSGKSGFNDENFFSSAISKINERLHDIKLAKSDLENTSKKTLDSLIGTSGHKKFFADIRNTQREIKAAYKEQQKLNEEIAKTNAANIKNNPLSLYGEHGLSSIVKKFNKESKDFFNSYNGNGGDDMFLSMLKRRIATLDEYLRRLDRQKRDGFDVSKEVSMTKTMRDSMQSVYDAGSPMKAYEYLNRISVKVDEDVRKLDNLFQFTRQLQKEIDKLSKVPQTGLAKLGDKESLSTLEKMKQLLTEIQSINISNVMNYTNTQGIKKNVQELIDSSQKIRREYKEQESAAKKLSDTQAGMYRGNYGFGTVYQSVGYKQAMNDLNAYYTRQEVLQKIASEIQKEQEAKRTGSYNGNYAFGDVYQSMSYKQAMNDMAEFYRQQERLSKKQIELDRENEKKSNERAKTESMYRTMFDNIEKANTKAQEKIRKENEKTYEDIKSKERKLNSEAASLANMNISGKGGTYIDEALRLVNSYKTELRNIANSGDYDKMRTAIAQFAERWNDVSIAVGKYKAHQAAANKLERESKRSQNGSSRSVNLQELRNEIRLSESLKRINGEIAKIEFKRDHKLIDKTQAQEAINKLNEYKRIVESLNKHSNRTTLIDITGRSMTNAIQNANRIANLSKEINRDYHYQSRLLSDLQGLAQQYFSLYAVNNFVKQLITIGGEFEKQHVALQTILGDYSKADALYAELKSFSIKSPFEFGDVVQQTKQLAAFGVEADDLMDTTRRLGDMAAGLGVDFSRLALAFGETKARSWLDGKELRQFAYAGVPLMQKLTEYYNTVKGMNVSPADVRKMIKNREVGFEDVKNVLWEMTDAGGMFFNMQEKMSETVAGKWKNLGDAYNVMLSEIESGNSRILGGMIDTLFELMNSWQSWLPLMSGLSVGIGIFSTGVGVATIQTKALTAAWSVLGKANWFTAILSVVVGIGAATWTAYQNAHRLENSMSEMNEKALSDFDNMVVKLNLTKDKLSKLKEGSDDYKTAIKELKKEYPSYFNELDAEKSKYDEIAKSIDSTIVKIKERTAAELYEQKKSAINAEYEEEKKDKIDDLTSHMGLLNRDKKNASILSRKTIAYEISRRINSSMSDSDIDKLVFETVKSSGFSFWDYFYDKNNYNRKKMIKDAIGLRDLKKWEEEQREEARKDTVELFTEFEEIKNEVKPYGGSEPASNENGDPEFKKWQTLKKHLEDYMDAYKKYRTIMSQDEAVRTTKSNNAFSDLLEFDPSDIESIYSDLRNRLFNMSGGGINKSESRKQAFDDLNDKELKRQQDKQIEELKNAKADLNRKIEQAKSQWDLYNQWLDATGDRGLSARMSGVNNISYTNVISQMRAELEAAMKKDNKNFTLEQVLGMDNDSLKVEFGESNPIVDSIVKLQEEYRKLSEESSKSLLEIVKNHQSYASQIATIDSQLAHDIETVSNSTMTDEKKAFTIEGLKRDAKEKKSNVLFEEFKNTTDWTVLFDDLDRVSTETINDMIDRIKSFAGNTDLTIKTVKELQNAMKKLREESIDRNPFSGLLDSFNRMKEARQTLKDNKNIRKIMGGSGGDVLKAGLDKSDKEAKDKLAAATDDFSKNLEGISSKFKSLEGILSPVIGLFSSLGNNSFSDVLGVGSSAISSGLGVFNGMKDLQTLFGSTSGIGKLIGSASPWGAAIGAGLSVVTSIFALHDKAIQREIDASKQRQKEMENLSSKLEKVLERTMGGIYSVKTGTNKSYYDTQLESLKSQRYEVLKQKQLEEDKKSSDDSAIADYKKQLDELDDEIQHFAEDMAKALYSIDFKSWADDLSSSLVEAWRNGEDAAEAWKDKISDILSEVGASVISQMYIQKALEPLMNEFLEQYEKDDGKITDASMAILENMYDKGKEAVDASNAYMEGMEKIANQHGETLKNDQDSSKSGLSSSIKNITEETADLLASYCNAIRSDLSNMRYLQESFFNESFPKMSAIAQSQLQQLNAIAQNTLRNADAAIRVQEILEAVTTGSKRISIQ